MEKRNIEYLDENHVKYTPVSTLYFVPELSNGTEEDTVNFVNLLEIVNIYIKFIRLRSVAFIKILNFKRELHPRQIRLR